MIVDILTLCDNAQQYQGKLVIVGTFNMIKFAKFPGKYPAMTFVSRIGLDAKEDKNYDVSFVFTKHGENDEIIPKVMVKISTVDNEFGFSYSNFILNMNNISFPSAGTYDLKLSIGEKDFIFKLFVMQQ